MAFTMNERIAIVAPEVGSPLDTWPKGRDSL